MSLSKSVNETVNYPKDSFDRFGDDLAEEILKWLPPLHKIRHSCVNYQFHVILKNLRNKQFIIRYGKEEDSKTFNNFTKVLKGNKHMIPWKFDKFLDYFPRITTLDLSSLYNRYYSCCMDFYSLPLDIIIKRDTLTTVYGSFFYNSLGNDYDMNLFVQKFGNVWRNLDIGFGTDATIDLIDGIRNIREIVCSGLEDIVDSGYVCLSNLEKASIGTVYDDDPFQDFVSENNQLVKFSLQLDQNSKPHLALRMVSFLSKLKELEISVDLKLSQISQVSDALSAIGKDCRKLTAAKFSFTSRDVIPNEFYNCFLNFTNLRSINFNVFDINTIPLSFTDNIFKNNRKIISMKLNCGRISPKFMEGFK